MIINLDEKVTAIILDGVLDQKLTQAQAIEQAIPQLQGLLGTLTQKVHDLRREGLADANTASQQFNITVEGELVFIADIQAGIVLHQTTMEVLNLTKTRLASFSKMVAKEGKYTRVQQDELKDMLKILLGLLEPPKQPEPEQPTDEEMPDAPI